MDLPRTRTRGGGGSLTKKAPGSPAARAGADRARSGESGTAAGAVRRAARPNRKKAPADEHSAREGKGSAWTRRGRGEETKTSPWEGDAREGRKGERVGLQRAEVSGAAQACLSEDTSAAALPHKCCWVLAFLRRLPNRAIADSTIAASVTSRGCIFISQNTSIHTRTLLQIHARITLHLLSELIISWHNKLVMFVSKVTYFYLLQMAYYKSIKSKRP